MRMLKMEKKYLLCILLAIVSINVCASKPKWIGNTPKALNSTYQFVEVISFGNSLNVARENAKQRLADNQQLRNAVMVNRRANQVSHIEQTRHNGNLNEIITSKVDINMVISGETFTLQAYVVDEYMAGYERGQQKLHTLYMVAITENPSFDKTLLTEKYGAGAAAMSIIPGLGQMYKGSYLKGGLMMAGTAAGVVSVLLCENQRADYKNKIKQQAQFAKDYNTKASNWETARNVAIGVTAAIYIYNLIDAAAAKGARRVIVKKANGNNLSFHPVATPYSAGAALTYNF